MGWGRFGGNGCFLGIFLVGEMVGFFFFFFLTHKYNGYFSYKILSGGKRFFKFFFLLGERGGSFLGGKGEGEGGLGM